MPLKYFVVPYFIHMKSISFFILVFIILSVVASCQKDAKKELSKKEILTSHGWKFSSIVTFGSAYNSYGVVGIEDCAKDDCLVFKSDGTYITKIGSIKCNPNETDYVLTWSLSDDGSSTFGGTQYYSIFSVEIDKVVFKWEYAGSGVKLTYVSC